MTFGKVTGTVVASQRSDEITGLKYLLVRSCNEKGDMGDDYLVALDLVGCGRGEMVLLSQGSSVRQTEVTKQKAVDCVIVGIVDLVEKQGKVVFRK